VADDYVGLAARRTDLEARAMLAKSVVCAAVPVADLDRAQRFYGETLGLLAASMGDPDEAFYLAGGQAMLHVLSGEDGFKAAWIRDPEGNILSLEQLAAPSEATGATR
jgi:catechol 2,3-dioxygenase-like lactoylglutathione lyase family enzyme